MKHHFEYRIGRIAIYSSEQWNSAAGEYLDERLESVKKVEPEKWQYDLYACISDENGHVIKTSKYPCQIIGSNVLHKMRTELLIVNHALNLPVFERDDFGAWDYLVTNSYDLTEEIVDGAIKELDNEK